MSSPFSEKQFLPSSPPHTLSLTPPLCLKPYFFPFFHYFFLSFPQFFICVHYYVTIIRFNPSFCSHFFFIFIFSPYQCSLLGLIIFSSFCYFLFLKLLSLSLSLFFFFFFLFFVLSPLNFNFLQLLT